MNKKEYLQHICDNQGRLLGFIKSLHFNGEEAKDILQDTNLTLLNKRKDFDKSKKFLPWAFAIARFTWMAHKKKKAREQKKLLYDSHVADILLEMDSKSLRDQLGYEVEVERIRLLKIVREELSVKQNTLLDCLLEGERLLDIAAHWGVKYGSLQTLKFRTIRKIRDVILKIKQQERNNEKREITKAKQKLQEAEGGHINLKAQGL